MRQSARVFALLLGIAWTANCWAAGWTAFEQTGSRRAVGRVFHWTEGYRHGTYYSGTGTLIRVLGRQAIVLTAAHIFEKGQGPITVEFCDSQQSGARILAKDEQLDVAALLVFAPRGIKPIPLASDAPPLGEHVEIWGYGPQRFRSFLATIAAPIPMAADEPDTLIAARGEDRGEVTIPGDSGGPVMAGGRLVGVHWGYRGADTDPRRSVHALSCGPIALWLHDHVEGWSAPKLAAPPAEHSPIAAR